MSKLQRDRERWAKVLDEASKDRNGGQQLRAKNRRIEKKKREQFRRVKP